MCEIEELTGKLPGLDCGSCGAPSCMAFAEDVVKCQASTDECTVILKRLLKEKNLHSQVLTEEFERIWPGPEQKGKCGDDHS